MASEKRLIYLEDAKEALIGWETDPTDEEIEWALDQLPTVDAVEVVHGRWIIGTGENALMRGYRMCSVCGEIIKTQYSLYGMFNYCPNCGAKIDGERKDNE